MEDIKCILFKNTPSNDKVGALYLNNMINIKVRFETLKNTNVLEVAEYEGKKGSLREILLGIKHNKTQLFVGVEQGKGNNQNRMNALILAKLKTEG